MEIQIALYLGVLFGIRSFPATEVYPYTEHHIYLPFIYIAFLNKIQ